MKKTLVALILGLLSTITLFADNIQVGDFYYKFSGVEATVTYKKQGSYSDCWGKCYTKDSYEVPSTITYKGLEYNVTTIDDRAFGALSDGDVGATMSSIKLPTSIKVIGYAAFSGCENLTRITIPHSVTRMSIYTRDPNGLSINTFQNCDFLREIVYTSATPPKGWVATAITYVPNKSAYGTPAYTINNANIYEMITWAKDTFEYTGVAPILPSYTCNLSNYNVSFSTPTLQKDAGTWTVNIEATFTNGDDSFVAYIPYTYTITPKVLTVTADDKQREYGDNNPELTITYSGFVNGESNNDLTTPPLATTTATNTSDVGTYPITISGATANNYEISYKSGTLTITPAPLSICVNDTTKTYGKSNPAFSCFYIGLKNNETKPIWTTSPTFSCSATVSSPVGNYSILLENAVAKNYSLVNNQSGILRITPAPLTIYANNLNKYYGDENPALTYRCSGFVNGENNEILIQQPVLSTTATDSSNVGTYPITISGADASNYTITYLDGTLTIKKVNLKVTVGDYSRKYGEDNPEFTVTISGFVNGESQSNLDKLPVASTSATSTSNVGTYTIYVNDGSAINYNFQKTNGTLTITKANQTIEWDQNLENLQVGSQIMLTATSSAGTDIIYTIDSTKAASLYTVGESTYLDCKSAGTFFIKAESAGNINYNPTAKISKKVSILGESLDDKPLTIVLGEGGNITTNVPYGVTHTFNIKAAAGWELHTVTFNGFDVTDEVDENNNYTTPAITSQSILNITFKSTTSAVEDVSLSSKKVFGLDDGIRITGLSNGENIFIYTPSGKLLYSCKASSDQQYIPLPNDNVYIVKIKELVVKVAL